MLAAQVGGKLSAAAPAPARLKGRARRTHCSRAAESGAAATGFESIIEIDSAEAFDETLNKPTNAGKLVILDAGASWCGPCKLFKPTYAQFAEKYSGSAVFLACTGDKNPSTASIMKRLGIKTVPSFHFFRDGVQIHQFSGANKTNFNNNLKLHLDGVSDE